MFPLQFLNWDCVMFELFLLVVFVFCLSPTINISIFQFQTNFVSKNSFLIMLLISQMIRPTSSDWPEYENRIYSRCYCGINNQWAVLKDIFLNRSATTSVQLPQTIKVCLTQMLIDKNLARATRQVSLVDHCLLTCPVSIDHCIVCW